MIQQLAPAQKAPLIKVIGLPILEILPFVTKKEESGKELKILNKNFNRESFEEVLSSLKSYKTTTLETFLGYKETKYYPKLIESLTRIATSTDYQYDKKRFYKKEFY